MGFFKEFKEDFSEAVNELVPGGEELEPVEEQDMVLNENMDTQSELSKLEGLLEQVSKKVDDGETVATTSKEEAIMEETPIATGASKKREEKVEDVVKMDTMEKKETTPVYNNVPTENASVSDETAVITAGMIITGNLESTGSIEVEGMIHGNVNCNGKLVVTGGISGNSSASEFFADSAKIEGEVNSSGTVKVGVGSVIIGNISATSAVIAGAVKGDIDVQGPVVVDTSAVIMGNIKSRSVQINNGAVIEGFCSQCYSEVDVEGLFS